MMDQWQLRFGIAAGGGAAARLRAAGRDGWGRLAGRCVPSARLRRLAVRWFAGALLALAGAGLLFGPGAKHPAVSGRRERRGGRLRAPVPAEARRLPAGRDGAASGCGAPAKSF